MGRSQGSTWAEAKGVRAEAKGVHGQCLCKGGIEQVEESARAMRRMCASVGDLHVE